MHRAKPQSWGGVAVLLRDRQGPGHLLPGLSQGPSWEATYILPSVPTSPDWSDPSSAVWLFQEPLNCLSVSLGARCADGPGQAIGLGL